MPTSETQVPGTADGTSSRALERPTTKPTEVNALQHIAREEANSLTFDRVRSFFVERQAFLVSQLYSVESGILPESLLSSLMIDYIETSAYAEQMYQFRVKAGVPLSQFDQGKVIKFFETIDFLQYRFSEKQKIFIWDTLIESDYVREKAEDKRIRSIAQVPTTEENVIVYYNYVLNRAKSFLGSVKKPIIWTIAMREANYRAQIPVNFSLEESLKWLEELANDLVTIEASPYAEAYSDQIAQLKQRNSVYVVVCRRDFDALIPLAEVESATVNTMLVNIIESASNAKPLLPEQIILVEKLLEILETTDKENIFQKRLKNYRGLTNKK